MFLLKKFFNHFRYFFYLVNFLTTSFLLALVYFLIVGPTSLLTRRKHRDFFDLGFDSGRLTYWSEFKTGKSFKDFFRPY